MGWFPYDRNLGHITANLILDKLDLGNNLFKNDKTSNDPEQVFSLGKTIGN